MKAIVTGGKLNVRQAPTKAAAVVNVLEDAAEITILEDLGDWYRIEDGYVMKQYLKKKSTPRKKTTPKEKPGEKNPGDK